MHCIFDKSILNEMTLYRQEGLSVSVIGESIVECKIVLLVL